MLRRLPRPLFVIDHFLYPILAVLITVIVFAALNGNDGLSLADWAILAALVAIFVLVWWRFHARMGEHVPVNATALLRAVKHAHKPALIVFESEYCIKCMVLGRRVQHFSQPELKDMVIYHVSVNKEPGRTLFKQFDGRITPTYALIDAKGNLVEEWPLVLPVNRVVNTLTHPRAS